jgi:site-specific DNA recombinase
MGKIATVRAIARREGVTDRYVSQLIELAFLSPRVVEKALRGSTDVRMTTKTLVFDIDLDPQWSDQEQQILGEGCGPSLLYTLN